MRTKKYNYILSEKDIKEIATGYTQNGATYYAEKFGVTKQAVYYHVRRLIAEDVKIERPRRHARYARIVAELKADEEKRYEAF